MLNNTLTEEHVGYCAVTSNTGDCSAGDLGYWPTPPTLAACIVACRECESGQGWRPDEALLKIYPADDV